MPSSFGHKSGTKDRNSEWNIPPETWRASTFHRIQAKEPHGMQWMIAIATPWRHGWTVGNYCNWLVLSSICQHTSPRSLWWTIMLQSDRGQFKKTKGFRKFSIELEYARTQSWVLANRIHAGKQCEFIIGRHLPTVVARPILNHSCRISGECINFS